MLACCPAIAPPTGREHKPLPGGTSEARGPFEGDAAGGPPFPSTIVAPVCLWRKGACASTPCTLACAHRARWGKEHTHTQGGREGRRPKLLKLATMNGSRGSPCSSRAAALSAADASTSAQPYRHACMWHARHARTSESMFGVFKRACVCTCTCACACAHTHRTRAELDGRGGIDSGARR